VFSVKVKKIDSMMVHISILLRVRINSKEINLINSITMTMRKKC
jgi:hypothetical protein